MKIIILTILTLTITTNIFAASKVAKDERLCKIFQEKAINYKKTMRQDAYAVQTLKSYKQRAETFCSK